MFGLWSCPGLTGALGRTGRHAIMRKHTQSAFRLHKVAHNFMEFDGRIGVVGLQRGPYSPAARRGEGAVTVAHLVRTSDKVTPGPGVRTSDTRAPPPFSRLIPRLFSPLFFKRPNPGARVVVEGGVCGRPRHPLVRPIATGLAQMPDARRDAPRTPP